MANLVFSSDSLDHPGCSWDEEAPDGYRSVIVMDHAIAEIFYRYVPPAHKGRTTRSPTFVKVKTSATVHTVRSGRLKVLRGSSRGQTLYDVTPELIAFTIERTSLLPGEYSGLTVDTLRAAYLKILIDHGLLCSKHIDRLQRAIPYDRSATTIGGRMTLAAAYPVAFDCIEDHRFDGHPGLMNDFSLVSWAFRQRSFTGVAQALFGRHSGRVIRKLIAEMVSEGMFMQLGYVAALKLKNQDLIQRLMREQLDSGASHVFRKLNFKNLRKIIRTVTPLLKKDGLLRPIIAADVQLLIDTERMIKRGGYTIPDTRFDTIRELHDTIAASNPVGRIGHAPREERAINYPELAKKWLVRLNGLKSENFTIVMPTTTTQMYTWGEQLHNCMGMYFYEIEEGDGLVFILVDSEGTPKYAVELSVFYDVGGHDRFEIRQFLGPCNQEAPADVREEFQLMLEGIFRPSICTPYLVTEAA